MELPVADPPPLASKPSAWGSSGGGVDEGTPAGSCPRSLGAVPLPRCDSANPTVLCSARRKH